MIQLSPRGAMQYRYLDLIVGLLLCYALAFSLEALHHLPAQPLPDWLTHAALARLSAELARLLPLSAIVAAGCSMMGAEVDARRLLWLQGGWVVLVALGLIAAALSESRVIEIALAIFLLGMLGLTRAAREAGARLRVWRIGIILIGACTLLGPGVDGNWGQALQLFQRHVAFGVAGVSLVFWLMRGFSRVERDWADDGVVIVAALVCLGGTLISLAPLGLPIIVSLSATPLILLSFMILAGHFTRALGLRRAEASLAANWAALATLLWLAGGGFMGAVNVHDGIFRAMQGTAFGAAWEWLMTWVLAAIALAYVNAGAGELRGDNRRVTGYVPFWLIGFGVGIASVVGICRGVAAHYLRTAGGLEAGAISELLLPLTALWIICLLAVACGALTYALGYWARRPRIKVAAG